jgi:hypothetical protein
MVRLIRLRTAAGILGALLLTMIATPFVEALFESLPAWLSPGVLVVLGLAICRAALELFIGRGASEHVVGNLATDAIKWIIRLLFLPFRFLWWMLARVFAVR